MIENIFCLRSIFVFLLRTALIVGCLIYLTAGGRAQTMQPSPNPSPQATPTASPTPAPTVQQSGRDAQKTVPENLPGVPNIAPDYRSQERDFPDLGRVGVDLMQQRPLTLREAIELGLSNNKDIEVARQNTQISEFDLRGARGVFEPRFSVQTFYQRAVTPQANTIFGGADGKLTESTVASNATFNYPVPRYGGNFQAQFNNSRLNSDSPVNVLNPQFLGGLNLQYTQPLLRGRRIDQNRLNIEVAKKNLSLSDAQFRQQTINVINNVQRAYWDLTFALKNLQVQRDAVRNAKEQVASNQRQVNEGLLAPIDIVAAETQVANFEQAVYDALNQVGINENNLKNLIATSRNDSIWTVSLLPTDPVEVDQPNISLPDAFNEALNNRPELEQNNVARDINELNQRFFRDQTKPQFDLVANYNLAGLAGTPIVQQEGAGIFGSSARLQNNFNELARRANAPDLIVPLTERTPLPSFLTGNYFNSLTNIFAQRFPTFRLGFTISLPFTSEIAKAQLGRSLVQGRQIQTQRQQLEQSIQVDVRNALQTLRTSQARLRAAAIARENSEKQYESEQRRLEAGQSTVFLVLQRQTDLTNARGNELRAQTELNKAIADIQRATGNSLRAYNIVARLK